MLEMVDLLSVRAAEWWLLSQQHAVSGLARAATAAQILPKPVRQHAQPFGLNQPHAQAWACDAYTSQLVQVYCMQHTHMVSHPLLMLRAIHSQR